MAVEKEKCTEGQFEELIGGAQRRDAAREMLFQQADVLKDLPNMTVMSKDRPVVSIKGKDAVLGEVNATRGTGEKLEYLVLTIDSVTKAIAYRFYKATEIDGLPADKKAKESPKSDEALTIKGREDLENLFADAAPPAAEKAAEAPVVHYVILVQDKKTVDAKKATEMYLALMPAAKDAKNLAPLLDDHPDWIENLGAVYELAGKDLLALQAFKSPAKTQPPADSMERIKDLVASCVTDPKANDKLLAMLTQLEHFVFKAKEYAKALREIHETQAARWAGFEKNPKK